VILGPFQGQERPILGSGRHRNRQLAKKHMYGSFTFTPKGDKVEETPEQVEHAKRMDALYTAEDETEDIDTAKRDKDARKDAGDVPGLCGSCLNLRWIKTRLGHRDRYWCSNGNIQRMLPDGIIDTGDEITKCPYYSPRPKPTDMSLRDMFKKAVLIDIKEYEPGTDEDRTNRGVTYL